MAKTRNAAGGKTRSRAPRAKKTRLQLTAADEDLVARLATRTGLLPREVLERALAGYAAAVAPGMPLHPQPAGRATRGAQPMQKLFLSVDGKPEIEVQQPEFVLGSGEDADLRLDLPLISPRHARILYKDGRHIFEDLRSARGSFRQGEPMDVRFIENGDEFDLGGFLPVRFRLE